MTEEEKKDETAGENPRASGLAARLRQLADSIETQQPYELYGLAVFWLYRKYDGVHFAYDNLAGSTRAGSAIIDQIEGYVKKRKGQT